MKVHSNFGDNKHYFSKFFILKKSEMCKYVNDSNLKLENASLQFELTTSFISERLIRG